MSMLNKEVQDLLQQEFFKESSKVDNDMVLNLMFFRNFATKLSNDQIKGLFYLKSLGSDFDDIYQHVLMMRKETTPFKKFMKFINTITLADRIKGSAKLKDVLKSSVASPSTTVNMSELQPKELRESELKR